MLAFRSEMPDSVTIVWAVIIGNTYWCHNQCKNSVVREESRKYHIYRPPIDVRHATMCRYSFSLRVSSCTTVRYEKKCGPLCFRHDIHPD